MDPISIEGAWAHTPVIRSDARGSFLELFRGGEFLAALGYQLQVAQANCSVSRRGVIRGIHFADVPPGQAKYVSCLSGAILDVVVDLRTGSPGYGRWEAVRLDDTSRRSLFISEGLGHAFTALSETATVVYLCSTPYTPDREHGVHPLDPAVGIAWPGGAGPGGAGPVLSDKDAAAPSLAEARAAGLLPSYRDCRARTEALRAAGARQPAARPDPARPGPCEHGHMAARKDPVTRPTDASVARFLAGVPDERRREDAGRLCAMMQEITGEPPAMWGSSIVGFGAYHYRYASGHEGDAPLASFSPRRQHLVIYLASEFGDRHQAVLARLGPHQAGKGCLYVKRLGDVDEAALRELIGRSVRVHRGIDRASG